MITAEKISLIIAGLNSNEFLCCKNEFLRLHCRDDYVDIVTPSFNVLIVANGSGESFLYYVDSHVSKAFSGH